MQTNVQIHVQAQVLRLAKREAGRTFAWGRSDCFLWAADVVHTLTGRDPAADLRGTYHNALGAMYRLRALGGIRALAAARFGPEVSLSKLQPGAVVLLAPSACEGPHSKHGALAVAVQSAGEHKQGYAVAQGEDGLVLVSLMHAVVAWQGGAAWPA